MTDEVREKVVLALTSTTREQCKGFAGYGDTRCALGLIAESVCGAELLWENAPYAGMGPALETVAEELGWPLVSIIMQANDSDGRTFSEIAKIVKDW